MLSVLTVHTPLQLVSTDREYTEPVRQLFLRVVKVVTDEEPFCVFSLTVSHNTAI